MAGTRLKTGAANFVRFMREMGFSLCVCLFWFCRVLRMVSVDLNIYASNPTRNMVKFHVIKDRRSSSMKENAPTEHKNNWPGTRIGHLTVMDATDQRKGGYTVWRCRCDCGNEILLDTRALQRQAITDCGCITKVKPGQKDMTGQRFGKLVCLYPERDKSKNGSSVWRCRCDCGNECSTTRRQLICGYKKSCGCSAHPPEKEYTGQKFGRLTVLGYAGKKSGQRMWKCRCDCGNICTVRQTKLQSGLTVSCGCYNAEKCKESQKMWTELELACWRLSSPAN